MALLTVFRCRYSITVINFMRPNFDYSAMVTSHAPQYHGSRILNLVWTKLKKTRNFVSVLCNECDLAL